MSETRRTQTNTSSSRNPRKSNLRNPDDDKQRERKRALDRKAQRASREKTRAHIAQLEQMVRILSENNGNATISELMEEMGRLHAEIDRLRKIIESIKSILGTDAFEASTSRSSQLSTYDDRPESPTRKELKYCDANSSSDECGTNQARRNWNRRTRENSCVDLNAHKQMSMEVGEGLSTTPMETESNNVREKFDWANKLGKPSMALTNKPDGKGRPKFEPSLWSLPNPIKTRLPTPPLPEFPQCKYWKKANVIYAGIFDYDKEQILAANNVDSGSLFKVVKEGWGSLSREERQNPVLQILEEVDQNLFWDLDPVTKIANLYKSHLLLKYFFNAERRNLEQIPAWQRPVHSQQTRRHPLPIDFFPWPALRDRLVRQYQYYFATSDFSIHYRQNFKFNWPFGFDETYRYVPATRTYQISPLFERYYSDENSWSMEEVFFAKFPEYIGEIPVRQLGPNDLPLSSTPIADPQQTSAPLHGGAASPLSSDRATSNNFEDECMMALFDELPPT